MNNSLYKINYIINSINSIIPTDEQLKDAADKLKELLTNPDVLIRAHEEGDYRPELIQPLLKVLKDNGYDFYRNEDVDFTQSYKNEMTRILNDNFHIIIPDIWKKEHAIFTAMNTYDVDFFRKLLEQFHFENADEIFEYILELFKMEFEFANETRHGPYYINHEKDFKIMFHLLTKYYKIPEFVKKLDYYNTINP